MTSLSNSCPLPTLEQKHPFVHFFLREARILRKVNGNPELDESKMRGNLQAGIKLKKPSRTSRRRFCTRNRGRGILRSEELSVGDFVSFSLQDGRRLHGVIEIKGRRNLRILAENGAIYSVPGKCVRKEDSTPVRAKLRPVTGIDRVVPLVLSESRRLLTDCGIELMVRYKPKVWSTHFRPNRHIQYGERCLAYQLTPIRPTDNVGANLRRFRIPADIPARLAMLVCHEVAHALAHRRYGAGISPHGRQFYMALNELVESEFSEIREKFLRILDSAKVTVS